MRSTNNRSTRRIAAMVLTGAMVAGGAGLVIAQQAVASPSAPTAAAPSQGPESQPRVESAAFGRFVPFEGQQSGAFKTALIPEGWTVQAADDSALLLAPPGADADARSFLGKILVSVGLGFPEREPAGAGTVVRHGPDGSIVRIDLEDGNYLAVQFPPTTGGSWSAEERLEFARGITVGAAEATAG